MKRFKAFFKKVITWLPVIYVGVFIIELVRKNTPLAKYEEKARESVGMDGGFFGNIF